MPPTIAPESLCAKCRFVRRVNGRRGQTYLLCQNDAIDEKYPRQPVLACPGYAPDDGEGASGTQVPAPS
jgi:hypothetical protein